MAPADALAPALADAKARLQDATANALGSVWDGLERHDEGNVAEFVELALPLLEGAQRTTIALTDAFCAGVLERDLLGLDADAIIAELRGGTPALDVYRRPFVTLWSGLKRGEQWADAAHAGRARLLETSRMDVALAHARALDAVRELDPRVVGFVRHVHGTCGLCEAFGGVGGARFPLHPNCECVGVPTVDVNSIREGLARQGVAIRSHGELGPVLARVGDEFATEQELDRPPQAPPDGEAQSRA